jgi:hypothetical protein
LRIATEQRFSLASEAMVSSNAAQKDRCGRASFAIATILLLHIAMLTHQTWDDAPTLDESGHLIASIGYWKLGRSDLYCVTPRLVPGRPPGIPSRFMDLTIDWTY